MGSSGHEVKRQRGHFVHIASVIFNDFLSEIGKRTRQSVPDITVDCDNTDADIDSTGARTSFTTQTSTECLK